MEPNAAKKPKVHKTSSDVWQYFVKNEAGDRGTCQLCSKEFKFSGNTTNYFEHLRNIHEKYPKRIKKPKPKPPKKEIIEHEDVQDYQESPSIKRPRRTTYKDSKERVLAVRVMAPGGRRSGVWTNFTRLSDSTAQCSHCHNQYKFHRNTTNLWNHLKHAHEKLYQESKLLTPADVALRVLDEARPDNTMEIPDVSYAAGLPETTDGHPVRVVIPLPGGRSEVWKRNLFGFYSEDGKTISDRQKAVCRLCLAEIPYSGNTTNLGIHLAKRHSEEYLTMKAELEAAGVSPGVTRTPIKSAGQRPTIGSTVMAGHTNSAGVGGGGQVTLPRHGTRALNITDAIATFLAQDLHSASVATGLGFQRLLSAMEPRYVPADAQAVLEALQQRRAAAGVGLLERLSKVEACALTSDCWAADSGRNYCSLMARYVDGDWTVQHHVLKTLEITPDQTHANHIWDVNKVLADWGLMPRIVYHQSMESAAAVDGGLSMGEGGDSSGGLDPETSGGLVVAVDNPVITVEVSQMKVVAGLTNDSGNVALALKHLGMPSLPCFAHLVNSAVCAGISISEAPSVCELISRARRLVNHFSRNSKDRYVLGKRCEEVAVGNGEGDRAGTGEAAALLTDVAHRWTTTADMIGRLLETKGPINAVLMVHRERSVREMGLTPEEWYQLEELYGAMRAVAMAIGVLGGGDEYASCSMVAPMLARLKRKFMRIREHDTPAVFQFKRVVWDHLTPHYEGDLETQALFNVSTLLDPRFKELGHLPEEQRAAVVQTTRQMVVELEEAQQHEQLLTSEATAVDGPTLPKQSRRRMEELDLLFGSAEDDEGVEGQDGTVSGSAAGIEVDKYLQEAAIDIKDSPLDWWRRNHHRYSLLAKLAKRHLCVPATAVPSECILEQEGSVFYSRRRRLLADEVDNMIFLNKNYYLA